MSSKDRKRADKALVVLGIILVILEIADKILDIVLKLIYKTSVGGATPTLNVHCSWRYVK